MVKEQQKALRPSIMYIITQGILGGAPMHIKHLSESLSSSYNVHVVIGIKGPIYDDLLSSGISVYHIPELTKELNPKNDIMAIYKIYKLIRKIKPDIVSTHSSKAGVIGRVASRLCGVPAIFTAHGWAFTEGVPPVKRRFYILTERFAARWAKKIICVSENDLRLAEDNNVGKKTQRMVIHNGMPMLNEQYLAYPGEQKIVNIIMVARFVEPKDHRSVLLALSKIKTTHNYKVYFVGDGPLLQETKDLINDLNLNDTVLLLGSRTDVPELLAKSHIFVLVSKWEGFPRSIIEAMRAGLPVIASDVGGCRESVVDGKTGFLIPRDDIDMLGQKLELLISKPELRTQMGEAGYKRFEEFFTFGKMRDKTVTVYEDILKARKETGQCF